MSRYAAVFAFFLAGRAAAAARLRGFLDQAAQATLTGNVFDDAATGEGLLNFSGVAPTAARSARPSWRPPV